MVLLTPNFFAVQALEGLEAAGEERGILKDFRKGIRDGEKEEPVARAARELQCSSARSIKSAEWSLTDGLLYFCGKIYVPDTSNLHHHIVALSHDSRLASHSRRWKTLELVSQNYWWPQMSGTSPPVTCAFRPNHSDTLRPENSTLFLFNLLHETLSAWTSLSSCHKLQDMIPSWLSLIPSQNAHILFPLSLQSLLPEPHTFSSTMSGNITVSLRKSSPIEVPNS